KARFASPSRGSRVQISFPAPFYQLLARVLSYLDLPFHHIFPTSLMRAIVKCKGSDPKWKNERPFHAQTRCPIPMTTLTDIQNAAEILHGVAHVTPVITSRTLNQTAGATVFLKCENFQRVGAFKFRGAYHAIAT